MKTTPEGLAPAPGSAPDWKTELAALIDKAESECKWLHCCYHDLWFSPAQLRAENAKGSFVWGVVNWKLRDPKEKLARLEQEEKDAAGARQRFERELQSDKASNHLSE